MNHLHPALGLLATALLLLQPAAQLVSRAQLPLLHQLLQPRHGGLAPLQLLVAVLPAPLGRSLPLLRATQPLAQHVRLVVVARQQQGDLAVRVVVAPQGFLLPHLELWVPKARGEFSGGLLTYCLLLLLGGQEAESGSSYLFEGSVLFMQLLGAPLQLCQGVLQLADLQQTGREDLLGHQVQIFRGSAFLALRAHDPAVEPGLDSRARWARCTPSASATWTEAAEGGRSNSAGSQGISQRDIFTFLRLFMPRYSCRASFTKQKDCFLIFEKVC